MLDYALMKTVFGVVETHIPAAKIIVRIHGTEINSLRSNFTTEEGGTMWGIMPGAVANIWIKIEDLPAQGVADGDMVEVYYCNKWERGKVKSRTTWGETIIDLSISDWDIK
jgi:hypothetical protein